MGRERHEIINSNITTVENKLKGLIRAFSGDYEIVLATLQAEVLAQKKLIFDLTIIAPEQIDSIMTFEKRIRGILQHATYEGKRELIELLNVRVDLVHNEEGHRLNMTCDLPGSDHAKAIRQTKKWLQHSNALPCAPGVPAATGIAQRSFLQALCQRPEPPGDN